MTRKNARLPANFVELANERAEKQDQKQIDAIRDITEIVREVEKILGVKFSDIPVKEGARKPVIEPGYLFIRL